MDIKTISQWLLEHGFSMTDGHIFESAYAGYSVRVALNRNGGRTTAHRYSRRLDIAVFRLDQLWIDAHGMLRAAGLDNYFASRMKAGSPAPRWFPEGFRCVVYREAERPNVPVEELSNCERAMKWALENGFTKVGPRTFQADYADSIVEFHVGRSEIFTHLITGDRRELIITKPIRSIRFDDTGMIRGVGLDWYFVKEMEIGGETPIWFNASYIEALETGRARPSIR